MSSPPVPQTDRTPHVRAATEADAAAIADIYNHYVLHTLVTFEETAVTADEMASRLRTVAAAELPWLVAVADRDVLGYAYATKWKERIGYRFAVEISVYLQHAVGGRGVGTQLYDALFPLLHARGIHAVIGGIALPNAASVALHEKFGMHKVAHFEQTGIKFGQWVDVGYWQRVFSA
jgi:L-amino acid N-acyltransferase YncA